LSSLPFFSFFSVSSFDPYNRIGIYILKVSEVFYVNLYSDYAFNKLENIWKHSSHHLEDIGDDDTACTRTAMIWFSTETGHRFLPLSDRPKCDVGVSKIF